MDVQLLRGIIMYKRKKNQPYYTNRHSCFLLQYHLVLVTKYRNPVLFGPIKDLVYQTIQTICDEKGLVIWAEIPYISRHMPEARANTVSQMKELIVQNYNHPSIVVWGLSNEITISGSSEDLLENHRILNDLVHEMDKTRLTTIACVSMCKPEEEYVHIPDVVSYNHYFGWYGGDTSMNGPWFDNFHAKYPNIPIGVSEYGCEALNWHTSDPKQGDYTEEYQAYYHEELIKQLFTRKYIWATHVWNMFDFGADARAAKTGKTIRA